ncbi:MAG TPA: AEC family transporter, partial [Microvirga sp.]|nr:AEC family transporter [Microvirga sp.]
MSDLVGLFNLLAPFFGLIGLGFFCGKVFRRPEAGLAWMQFFLIYVSLPCLFYTLIADKPLDQLANGPFILATTICTYCAFALSYAAGLWHTRDMPQSVMQGVAGAYSNIGYMGPPLILSALGPAASAPVALIFVFDNLLLFSLVPLLMAVAGVEKRSLGATIADIAWKVITHPFNVATAVGVLASYAHLELPTALGRMVTWLSGAAAPCALFLLGVTVALRPLGRVPGEVPALVFIKLVLHPLLVWVVLSAIGNF